MRTEMRRRYKARTASGGFRGCDLYGDFREFVGRPDVDAVMVCTPDRRHASPAVSIS